MLDRSAFYPTSGGQINDIGRMTVNGEDLEVYNVEKVGRCFLHYLDKEID